MIFLSKISVYLVILRGINALLSSIFVTQKICFDNNMQSIPEIIRTIPLMHYIILSSALFCIGILGVLTRRNAIIVFMAIELMLNAVNLLLAAFSSYYSDPAGQIFVFFIMAVAAAEVAVGLAIIVMIYRNIQSIDIGVLNKIKN